ncbi:MAG TPA: hypothetical protein VFM99_06000 [Chitinophagales bacterium]|nr:hypothetical protein [Chitinophagales bacterium]
MMKSKNKSAKIIGWIILGAMMVIIMSLATMYLWNWLVPTLFNGPQITLMETIGLLLLVKIFTGISGMGYRKSGCHNNHHRSNMWKSKWQEKMAGMNEEEKISFKEMYYRRCGRMPGCGDDEKNT